MSSGSPGWAKSLPDSTILRIDEHLTPKLSRYIPHVPTPKQTAFLLLDDVLEVFFGGAGGPGKSSAVLMAALQYVDVPGYAALILRRDYQQLAMPGALMAMAHAWLDGSDAQWLERTKTWTFPSGATLTFGHVAKTSDVQRYQSAEFQFIAVDELTDFPESVYRFLFSRLRRGSSSAVPLRMRSASNPGGPHHNWVKARFVDKATREPAAVFVPARMEDNPHLDVASYLDSLRRTHPVTWRRIAFGDWEITDAGAMFRAREWLVGHWLDAAPTGLRARVRAWDLATTDVTAANPDPDWTAGALLSMDPTSHEVTVEHVVHLRATPGTVESAIRGAADADGQAVTVLFEQERGSNGAHMVAQYRKLLTPAIVVGESPSGSKVMRAAAFASAMENGLVSVVRAPWNLAWLDELEAFPGTGHDDMVDSAAYAFNALARGVGWPIVSPLSLASRR